MKVNVALSEQLAVEYDVFTLRRRRALARPMHGNCFHDALQIACAYPTSFYCEGYAAGTIPVEHAWVELDGEIIDVSWVDDDLAENVYEPTIKVSGKQLVEALLRDNRRPPWFWHPGISSDRGAILNKHEAGLMKLITLLAGGAT